ncbi:MAG: hypothetical protein P4L69_08105 [Desulfosporosinus sp.]|nr:hypothetical protein [Desulfosporosinus sp.]
MSDPVSASNPATKHYVDVTAGEGTSFATTVTTVDFSVNQADNIWQNVAGVSAVSTLESNMGGTAVLQISAASAAAVHTALLIRGAAITTNVPSVEVRHPIIVGENGVAVPCTFLLLTDGTIQIVKIDGTNFTTGRTISFNTLCIEYNLISPPLD